MNWRPRMPPGDAADNYEAYEIYDELCTPDGRVVATLACFVWNPTVYYCNALTPAGKWMRFRAGHRAYATTRDWAERVAGLKVDRDLSGRGERLKPAAVGGVPMTDDYRIYVEENWPATLNDGAGVPTDFATLHEAVLAWRSLAPEQKIRATIRVIGGPVYTIKQIDRLHFGKPT
jgi:hypothetical protein